MTTNDLKKASKQSSLYILLMLYLVMLSIPVIVQYGMIYSSNRIKAIYFNGMYSTFALEQTFLLLLLVPLFMSTAIIKSRGDISGILRNSTPSKIVTEKLLVAMSKELLLIIIALPIDVFFIWIGGIQVMDILADKLYLILMSIFVSIIYIWCWTGIKKFNKAKGVTYIIEIIYVFILPLTIMVSSLVVKNQKISGSMSENFIFQNPILCTFFNITPLGGYLYLLDSQELLIDYNIAWNMAHIMSVPGWAISVISQIILIIFFLSQAIKKIKLMNHNV